MVVTDGVRIRRAAPQDAQQVFNLARDMATSFAVDVAVFASSLTEIMQRDDAVVLVAEASEASGHVVVGYLLGFDHPAFYANGRVSYVEEVAVVEERQGKRVGRHLMEGFERWARTRDSTLVTVATRRADGFYRSLGYEETATLFRKVL
ncbi:MAG TPA: GNAT family N-acetyltransferase [Acidimicrobiales bacterium]